MVDGGLSPKAITDPDELPFKIDQKSWREGVLPDLDRIYQHSRADYSIRFETR